MMKILPLIFIGFIFNLSCQKKHENIVELNNYTENLSASLHTYNNEKQAAYYLQKSQEDLYNKHDHLLNYSLELLKSGAS